MYFTLTILLAITISIILLYIELNRRKYSKAFKNIYGETEYPFFGNLLTTINLNHIKDVNKMVDAVSKKPTTKLIAGPFGFLITYDPDLAHQILSSDTFLERPFLFEFFRMEHGVLMAKCELNFFFCKSVVGSFKPNYLKNKV